MERVTLPQRDGGINIWQSLNPSFIFGDKAFCLKGRMPTTISSTYSSELESFFRFGDSYLPAARWGVGDRPASKIFTIAAPRDIANVLNFGRPYLNEATPSRRRGFAARASPTRYTERRMAGSGGAAVL